MASEQLPRRLAANSYADVATYSRLTGADEDVTHRTLSAYLDLVAAAMAAQRVAVMHYAGDAVLARFDAVVDAIRCAVLVQRGIALRNQELAQERSLKYRVGLNIGDVIEDRGDNYGVGASLAACDLLIASCSQLSRMEEARDVAHQLPVLDPETTVSRLEQIFPLARHKNLNGLIGGLRKAGVAK